MKLESLPLNYRDLLSHHVERAVPFYFSTIYIATATMSFYLGLHYRLPRWEFEHVLKGYVLCFGWDGASSPAALDIRLNDAVAHSGGDYLDAFVL